LVGNTSYEASHYGIFCNLPFHSAQIFSLQHCVLKYPQSVFPLLNVTDQVSYPYKITHYSFVYSNFHVFRLHMRKRVPTVNYFTMFKDILKIRTSVGIATSYGGWTTEGSEFESQ
jgi:hypothetical protein